MILFLTACQQIDDDKKVINYSNYLKYSNTGFTLVYDEQLKKDNKISKKINDRACLLYTSPSPRDLSTSRMPSSA